MGKLREQVSNVAFTVTIWMGIIWCAAGILFCVKEMTKIIFEGLTTW